MGMTFLLLTELLTPHPPNLFAERAHKFLIFRFAHFPGFPLNLVAVHRVAPKGFVLSSKFAVL
jgi:hypothetical protein